MFVIALRKYILGAIIGLIVGMWFGVNIGEGRPFYSNPFATKVAKEKTSEIVDEGKEKLREKLQK